MYIIYIENSKMADNPFKRKIISYALFLSNPISTRVSMSDMLIFGVLLRKR